jgi:serine/threonine-protein kinase
VLFGEIAAGGMATVHLGRLSGAAGFARTVAVKRLHPQFAKDPDFVSMFLDEARLAARIRHPNVVPTLDIVETDGEIHLVMEYVHGASLARLMRAGVDAGTPPDPWIIATILSGVLHGLHAAHEATNEQGVPLQIVHRDVSPQNILVGIDGVARVVDFGVAKAVGRLQTTREGQVKGKFSYMAPEQITGREVTRRADIYSAGVVAWEALTSRRLFRADNEAAIVRAVLRDRVPLPTELAPDLPSELDAVVMRALDRHPARRFETAREMALELERCGGIVPASEVGAWVESLVHTELAAKQTRIAEIERMTSEPPGVRLPLPADGASQMRSEVSSIAVAPSRPPPPPTTGSRFAFGAGFFVAAALAGLAALLLLTREHTAGRLASPGTGAPSSAAHAGVPSRAPVPPPSGTVSPSTAPSTVGTILSVQASDLPVVSPPSLPVSALPTVPPKPPWRRRLHPVASAAPSAQPAAPASTVDCDPPYWIDEDGHTRYKPACL